MILNILTRCLYTRGWSKNKEGGGPEENGGCVSKFRALQRGGVGHDSFWQGVVFRIL